MSNLDKYFEFGKAMNEQVVAGANLVLRSLLIINGGAVVALLAFVASMVTAETLGLGDNIAELTAPLLWFGWGVVASVVAMALAYLTNYCVVGHSFAIHDGQSPKAWGIAYISFHVFAILVTIGSLSCFIYGLWAVRTAINALVPG